MSAHVCKHDCQQAAAFNATSSNKVAFQVKGAVFVHKAEAGMGEVRSLTPADKHHSHGKRKASSHKCSH